MERRRLLRVLITVIVLATMLGVGILVRMFNDGIDAQSDVPRLYELGETLVERGIGADRTSQHLPTSLRPQVQSLADEQWRTLGSDMPRLMIEAVNGRRAGVDIDVAVGGRHWRLTLLDGAYTVSRR